MNDLQINTLNTIKVNTALKSWMNSIRFIRFQINACIKCINETESMTLIADSSCAIYKQIVDLLCLF